MTGCSASVSAPVLDNEITTHLQDSPIGQGSLVPEDGGLVVTETLGASKPSPPRSLHRLEKLVVNRVAELRRVVITVSAQA